MLRNSSNSTSGSPIFRNIGITALICLVSFWIPLPFLNFDPHHDGLSLTTIELTKQALRGGVPVPFNQYGAFWTVPYLAISYIIPSEYLFLGMRFVTVLIYLGTARIMFKLSQLFLSKNLSIAATVLFLGAQPFNSDYGSSLVPWPSVVIMPLMPLIAYLMLKEVIGFEKSWGRGIPIGAIVPLVLFTRIQVGALLTLTVVIWLIWRRNYRLTVAVTLGFGLTLTFAVCVLQYLGWLNDSLYDQFIFGATYLSADKSTFPKPIITFFAAGLCALFLLLLDIFKRRFNFLAVLRSSITFIVVGLLGILSFLYLLLIRKMDFVNTIVIFTRRFWIVVGLGILLYSGITLALRFARRRESFNIFPRSGREVVLLLLALSFQSQVYPLFDQMHFWWGSPLTFVILALVLSRIQENLRVSLVNRNLILISATCLLIIVNLLPWISQISREKIGLPEEIGKFIYSGTQAASLQHGEQVFFAQNITPGARVLNLCDDPNVFFKPDTYVPASRFFVFWGEQMSHADDIIASFRSSNPDFLVTCGLTHAPALRVSQEEFQAELVRTILPGALPVASLALDPSKVWHVYKRNVS
jgi:hypothetical protein